MCTLRDNLLSCYVPEGVAAETCTRALEQFSPSTPTPAGFPSPHFSQLRGGGGERDEKTGGREWHIVPQGVSDIRVGHELYEFEQVRLLTKEER